MKERADIQKQYRQQQEKHVYYLLALTVTSIAFTINQTNGIGLKWVQIPVGIAIVSWAYSVYCGIYFMKYVISTLYAEHELLAVEEEKKLNFKKDKTEIDLKKEGIREAIIHNSKKVVKLNQNQNIFFFVGMISFIVWHILEMVKLTI